jgi:4-hydroxy-4-methyl-2-oxoglutarate aldolase
VGGASPEPRGVRGRLMAGELGLDIYGMRDRLKAKGLKYI